MDIRLSPIQLLSLNLSSPSSLPKSPIKRLVTPPAVRRRLPLLFCFVSNNKNGWIVPFPRPPSSPRRLPFSFHIRQLSSFIHSPFTSSLCLMLPLSHLSYPPPWMCALPLSAFKLTLPACSPSPPAVMVQNIDKQHYDREKPLTELLTNPPSPPCVFCLYFAAPDLFELAGCCPD